MKILAVIPARGGSKRCPRKNIRSCAGRPLLGWTIEQAKEANGMRVVVSSDDQEILSYAKGQGVEIIERPENLAGDLVSSSAVALHALSMMEADYVVLLQPTSPLRASADIANALYISHKYKAPCVSVTSAGVRPELLCGIDNEGRLFRPVDRFPVAYRLNGAVYVSPSDVFQEHGTFMLPFTRSHVMPKERSLDIDTEEDFRAAHEALHRKLYEMVM